MVVSDVGLIGLAVMGQNLACNLADHGYKVTVFNRTLARVPEFLQGEANGKSIVGASSLREFVSQLQRPRKIILMVRAGQPVDEIIEEILPFLAEGDVIMDGGNSHFLDTQRRCDQLKAKNLLFIGAGISGGEEGARKGPSIMPGGNSKAWPLMKEMLQTIAAHVKGEPCCEWIGEGGAGHYVKMVHNGIEYGDMQLIAEAFSLLQANGLSYPQISETFSTWNEGKLQSYLVEITAKVVRQEDEDGTFLLDHIEDIAHHKGTGKWTVENALTLGEPLTVIAEAFFARALSSLKEERSALASLFPSKMKKRSALSTEKIGEALYGAKIISYAQGFSLLKKASESFHWSIDYGKVALLWRGGCIIRSSFLEKIAEAFQKNPQLTHLFFDRFFQKELKRAIPKGRRIIGKGIEWGLPLPCFSAAFSYFDGYRLARGSAALIQAQRDFFGAHGFERVGKPREELFHGKWD